MYMIKNNLGYNCKNWIVTQYSKHFKTDLLTCQKLIAQYEFKIVSKIEFCNKFLW